MKMVGVSPHLPFSLCLVSLHFNFSALSGGVGDRLAALATVG